MSGLRWDETGELATADEVRLARYSFTEKANHPYFDVLRSLDHAGALVNHAPWDHRWHHGLWWSWKFVNDVLFWEDHPDYGGNRIGLGRSTVGSHVVDVDADGRPRVREELSWRVDESGQQLFAESRTLTAIRTVVGGRPVWAIDWDQRWTASVDVHLTTTPYPEISWGGYGGLAYRPARSMVERERIVADGGRVGVEAVHGKPAAWAAYTGCVDGAGDDEPKAPATGGLAILEHPENPRYPGPIYAATATAGFGFLAAAPLLAEDLSMSSGEDLRLRYRTLVLGFEPDPADLSAAHAEYAK